MLFFHFNLNIITKLMHHYWPQEVIIPFLIFISNVLLTIYKTLTN